MLTMRGEVGGSLNSSPGGAWMVSRSAQNEALWTLFSLWTFFSRPLLRISTIFTWKKTKLKLMLFNLVQTNVPLFRPRRLKQFEKSNSKEGMQKFRIAWEGGLAMCWPHNFSPAAWSCSWCGPPSTSQKNNMNPRGSIHGNLLEPKPPTLMYTIINISLSLANHMTGTPTVSSNYKNCISQESMRRGWNCFLALSCKRQKYSASRTMLSA